MYPGPASAAPSATGRPGDLAIEAKGVVKRFGKVEALSGLDPGSRSQLWQAIRQLAAQGTDVLLTTQYLDEADQLAHQIVIIDRGQVIAHGTPSQLKGLAGRDVVEVHARQPDDLPQIARALAAVGGRDTHDPQQLGGSEHQLTADNRNSEVQRAEIPDDDERGQSQHCQHHLLPPPRPRARHRSSTVPPAPRGATMSAHSCEDPLSINCRSAASTVTQ